MKVVVIFLPVMLSLPAYSQQEAEEIDPQQLLNDLLAPPEPDAGNEDLYENVLQIMTTPHDLNKITEDELRQLHVLSDDQVENFISYRTEHGPLLDIHELQAIPGMDPEAIASLLPFVTARNPERVAGRRLFQRIFSSGSTYFISRYERTLESRKGAITSPGNASTFRGSPDKIYMRLRSARAGDYSIGFTAEKDAGEKLTFGAHGHPRGFDYTSFHAQLQQKGKLTNLIVGDFQTQFGQGLLLGGAFGLGKGSETVSTARKSNVGFLPYTSVNESAYRRGIALTVRSFKRLDVSLFYSRARRDAATEETGDTLSAISFQTAGLHRTESELLRRKKVTEQSCGVVMRLNKKPLDAGFILHAMHFDIPVQRTPTLYNQFAFAGSEHMNAGVFLNYRFQNISFFSEAGRSLSGGVGAVWGILVSPHPRLDIAIVCRHYATKFHTFSSNAFSENTQPVNEHGVYWGWKYRWNRQFSLSGYADLFRFPWLTYRRYAPAVGYEWFVRGNYAPSRRVSIALQAREESKPRNAAGPRPLYQLQDGLRRNISVYSDYTMTENIRLKFRLQYSSYSVSNRTTEGFAVIHDVSFKWKRFKFSGRQALFDTDHYDNRQYVYEQDAWLAYSLPAYSGVGVRNYALIEYKVHKQLTLWLRFAVTRLTKGGEIGSGPDGIEGNTRNDVKFQLRLRF